MIEVTRRHLRLIDPGKNHRKFYTLYTSDMGHVLFHWGRIDTAGQWKSDKVQSNEVEDFARRQMYAKLSKGYTREGEEVFQAQVDDFHDPRRLERALTTYRVNVGATTAEQKATSEIDAFIEQINALITATKETDSAELMEEYLALQDSWTALQGRMSTAETAMEMLGMRMKGEI